eukprot:3683705-Pleurochrysis_carterae.AAC.1
MSPPPRTAAETEGSEMRCGHQVTCEGHAPSSALATRRQTWREEERCEAPGGSRLPGAGCTARREGGASLSWSRSLCNSPKPASGKNVMGNLFHKQSSIM